MARKPMVSRTIVTTKCTVLCLNLVNCEPFTEVVTVPRTYKDEAKLFKKVQSVIDNDEQKAVHITSSEEVETLYGMPEQEFINHAVELDPDTRRPIDNDTDEEDTEEEDEE